MRLAGIRNDDGNGGGGYYHARSRVADGKFIFDVRSAGCVESGYFLKLMRKLEAFHGMKVITYALMSNHFHILVRELLRQVTSIEDDERWPKSAI